VDPTPLLARGSQPSLPVRPGESMARSHMDRPWDLPYNGRLQPTLNARDESLARHMDPTLLVVVWGSQRGRGLDRGPQPGRAGGRGRWTGVPLRRRGSQPGREIATWRNRPQARQETNACLSNRG